ncbi:MAG: aldo/keto reductase [delta proteobacterium ML8_F1]|nr:MAG: aldo/keto reductase [delta proteobacterium ML8_F1]
MEKIRLPGTELVVSRTAFGALPIQRLTLEDARVLLRKAYSGGINFFDTARMYSDSEAKIGEALAKVRKDIVIASKSHAGDKAGLLEHLETSLRLLKTDYLDLLQLHNPKILPDPGDPESLYAGAVEAKKRGWIRHIGITSHSRDNALEACRSGYYDTVQFPLNYLATEEDLELIKACKENAVGLIAMKGLAGGLLQNATAAFAFLRQFDGLVPIWGIQRESELEEFLSLEKNPPQLDEALWAIIHQDREALQGEFCRGCGYCLPCPAGIEINMAARISHFLNRSVYQRYMTGDFKEKMERINDCILCGHCSSHCPYGLDVPNLLKRQLTYYEDFYEKFHGGSVQ